MSTSTTTEEPKGFDTGALSEAVMTQIGENQVAFGKDRGRPSEITHHTITNCSVVVGPDEEIAIRLNFEGGFLRFKLPTLDIDQIDLQGNKFKGNKDTTHPNQSLQLGTIVFQ